LEEDCEGGIDVVHRALGGLWRRKRGISLGI
jgi:hypothetical protein